MTTDEIIQLMKSAKAETRAEITTLKKRIAALEAKNGIEAAAEETATEEGTQDDDASASTGTGPDSEGADASA